MRSRLLFYRQFYLTWFFRDLDLNKNGTEGFSAGLIDDDNIFRWQVLIMGPADTI